MMSSFEFGAAYSNETESYESLLNSDSIAYGDLASTVILTLDFKGLGLPERLFSKFNNLINIISNGTVSCNKDVAGMCLLPGLCSAHSFIDEFSFKVNFTTTGSADEYLVIPLSTFAVDTNSA